MWRMSNYGFVISENERGEVNTTNGHLSAPSYLTQLL